MLALTVYSFLRQLVIASAFSISLFAVPIVSDDFEDFVLSNDWDDPVVNTTIETGVGAAGSPGFATITPTTGILGAIFEGGASDFFVDFYLRVSPGGRQFNMMVTVDEEVSLSGAVINLRHEDGAWTALAGGGWQTIVLPGMSIGNWHRVRLTCSGWGRTGAHYDLEISGPGSQVLTSKVDGLSYFQGGDPSSDTAGSFSFSTLFGNSPGFDVDEVTVETVEVIVPDDPDLTVSSANPFAGLTPGANPDPITVDVLIENTGATENLVIADSSAFSGISGGNFSILSPLPVTIFPGANTTIQLGFDDADTFGTFQAMLSLDSNDESSPALVIPVSIAVPSSDGNLLGNGDFEEDGVMITKWETSANPVPQLETGIAPGSSASASLGEGGFLKQSIAGGSEWYCDFFFEISEVPFRAFNVIFDAGGGTSLNLRYHDSTPFGSNTWNVFTDVDGWDAGLALPKLVPNETYFMRIIGRNWEGASPSYDLMLSDPGETALTNVLEGVTRFRGSVPASGPQSVSFTAEYGESLGYLLDDARFFNGPPPPPPVEEGLQISHFDFDVLTQKVTFTWDATPGTGYDIFGSSDLVNWGLLENRTATGTEETFVEEDVPTGFRAYRVQEHAGP